MEGRGEEREQQLAKNTWRTKEPEVRCSTIGAVALSYPMRLTLCMARARVRAFSPRHFCVTTVSLVYKLVVLVLVATGVPAVVGKTREGTGLFLAGGSRLQAILFGNIVIFTQTRMMLPSTFVPLLLYSTLFLVTLWPRSPFREPRQALVRVLWGTLLSPLAGVHFVHVIVGDLLTSYSKVFHDMYGASCVILTSEDRHFHADLLRSCRNDQWGIIVASIPTWLVCSLCRAALPVNP